jgi:hypothetical protein
MKLFQKFVFFGACIFIISCVPKQTNKEEIKMSTNLYEIPENCNFANVHSGSQENECSPVLKDPFFSGFSGILINGPKEIIWPKNVSLEDHPPGPMGTTDGPLRLMIAGLVRIKFSTLGLKGDAGGEVLLVAVDQKTAKSYSGKMPNGDFEAPPFSADPSNEPQLTDEEKNALLSSHFNMDLVHDLELPIADATYTIYATLGDYKSNELVVSTKVK